MAINKVIYQGNTLIDLTTDTVTPETLSSGVTAHMKNGETIVGTLDPSIGLDTTDATADATEILAGETAYAGGSKITGTMPNNGKISGSFDGLETKSYTIPEGYTSGGTVSLTDDIDNEVDEQADLINQIKSAIDNLPDAAPTLQRKTVDPSTSAQTVTADAGYDGLSRVTVNAISTTTQASPEVVINSDGLITASVTQTEGYVVSGTKVTTKQITTQGTTTITPGKSSQTAVPAYRYTTGVVTVEGDDNLVAENIKSGVNIFGIDGSYGGSGEGGYELPELTNPASATEILSGYEVIDEKGEVITGSIATKTSSDLVTNGASVTIPSGYYTTEINKTVKTTVQANPMFEMNLETGLITANVAQPEGYVNAGTKSVTKYITIAEGVTY